MTCRATILNGISAFFHRHQLLINGLSLVGLQFVYASWTILVPFFSNGLPTGWDSGAYLAWANSLKLGGFNYVQNPNFYQYAGLNLVPGLLLVGTVSISSLLVGYVLFQIITLGLFFASMFFLSWQLRRSFSYTLLVVALLITSYAFIRMTRDLYGNLLCMSFLQFALGLLIVLKKRPNRMVSLGLFSSTTLMFFTDVEVGGFGLIVLLSSILLDAFGRRQFEIRRMLVPVLASALLALGLWSTFAVSYLSVSTLLVSPLGAADWQTILLSLGGYFLIPLWVATMILITYEMRKRTVSFDHSILIGWSLAVVLTCGILLVYRPSLTFRVAYLFPLSFVLAEAFRRSWNLFASSRKARGFVRPASLLILLSIGVLVTVASATTFVSQTYSYQTAPFISRSEFQTLTKASAMLKSGGMTSSNTVFLIYPQQRLRNPQVVSAWTNLYDNWISATFGPHVSYYGTIGNLTFHIPLNFLSSDEENTFRYYRNMFEASRLSPSIHIVMISFLYSGNEIKYNGFSNPLPEVYESPWNASAQNVSSWMPSYYALNETAGYFATQAWSYSGTVLESYRSTPSNYSNNFQANFSIYASRTTTYSLELRMYDYSPSNSPIMVSIDGETIFGFSYYGSQVPTIFSGPIGNLTRGNHILTLSTLLNAPHNLDLDSIRLSSSGTDNPVPLVKIAGSWGISDGSGTLGGGFGGANLILVNGTSDSGGLLGVDVSFPAPMDLSGSRFLTFQFNASGIGSIGVWLTDSSGNTIRYDTRYDYRKQMQVVTVPIVPYGYSSSSSTLPAFTGIQTVELGLIQSQQAPISFDFTNPIASVNPIPFQYLTI